MSSRAIRQFELFLGIDGDALRPDQHGSYDEHEQAEFLRQRQRPPITDGELICTITYDHEHQKIIYDFADGRHLEQ